MNRRVLRTALAALFLAPLVVALPATPSQAVTGADWIPGYIIGDATLFNGSAMSVEQVQAFMDLKVPACQPGSTCLKDFRQPTPDLPADAYCGAYVGSPDERASDIIAKVGTACNVSQNAILVILQKETSLVTLTAPASWRFDRAMGYACPDTVPVTCNPAYASFFYQVYLAARQLQRYSAPETSYHWYPIGALSEVRYSTNAACGSSAVFIENRATAALYYYTPYQPNAAALANLGGTGDGCSAYGNRNFWKLYWDWFGSPYGASFPTVAGAADAASIGFGASAGATATVDPAPGSGSAFLQYLAGSTWVEFTTPVAVVSGHAHLTWTPSQTYQYRFRFGSTYSPAFTITVTPPTVTGAPDAASILVGGTAGATATVSPAPASGSAYLQYLAGSTWVEFASPVAVVSGQAHLTWVPSKTYTYRFRVGSTLSDPFTIAVVTQWVTVTTDAASIPVGGTAGATATVDPTPASGSAYLQYLAGSTWVEFATPVAVVAGQAHLTWVPSKTYQYRFRFGSTLSDPFTITVTPPTVTGAPDAASIPVGGTAGATATVDPAPSSGSAYLQYLAGSTWVEFASPVAVVAGHAHLTWKPSTTYQYRFRVGSVLSDPFTITVTLPTVTGASDAASIPAGGTAGATATVSPAPTGGSVYLQYLAGATWVEFASPVAVVAGQAHLTWVPSKTYTYRFRYGSVLSDPFTITVTPPTVTGASDAASIPVGGTAGATATVDPAPASGSAYLQYLAGSTWVEFASPVAVVSGHAHLTWVPSKTYQYRFRFGSTLSDPFTITVTPTS